MTFNICYFFIKLWIFNTEYNTENFETPILELEDLELQERRLVAVNVSCSFFLSGEGIFIKKMDLTDFYQSIDFIT